VSGPRRGGAFLALGVVFLAVGASGRAHFIALGVAFLAIGVVFLVRDRRGESK
jgi:hypothetical protein